MKKILILLDAQNYKAEILDFAAYIARAERSKLVGIFVEKMQDAVPSIKSIGGQMYVEEIVITEEEQNILNEKRNDNMQLFKEGCIQREISASVHHFPNARLKDIIHETRYADLIIADPAISLSKDGAMPVVFTELLEHAECPVLIAPEYFEQPKEIVFAYNGSKSSVFAIKQFCYQFSAFADIKVTVLHVIENGSDEDYNKERKEFTEWLDIHFGDVSYVEVHGNARDALFNYFMGDERNDKLLVMGAFGRNLLSSFFKHSAAELVLKAIDVPIFIAHY